MRFTRRNRALRKTGWAAPGDRPRPRGDGSSIHRETRGDAARASRCFTLLTSTCGVADHSTGSEQVNGTGLRVRGLLVLMTVLGTACALLMQGCEKSLPPGTRAERIVIEKAARRLTIYREGVALKSYRVALGSEPVGPKRTEGDHRTPEGRYTIDWRNRDSQFHRALHVSYPSQEDSARARARGEAPGGNIMIHGLPEDKEWLGSFHRRIDWTDGCIAVTNPEIEELWAVVPDGTPVEIRP